MLDQDIKDIYNLLKPIDGIKEVGLLSGEKLSTSRTPAAMITLVSSTYTKPYHGVEHKPARQYAVSVVISVHRDNIDNEIRNMKLLRSIEEHLIQDERITLTSSFLDSVRDTIRVYVINFEIESEEILKQK